MVQWKATNCGLPFARNFIKFADFHVLSAHTIFVPLKFAELKFDSKLLTVSTKGTFESEESTPESAFASATLLHY